MDVETFAFLFLGVREFVAIVAVGVALCSLDDIVIDALYFIRLARRNLTIYRRYPRATVALLPAKAPQWMAILVPAWDESAVIGPMLRNTLRRLDYPAYRIFVGLYPNDPASAAAVAAIGDERIIRAVTRSDGPTTKADCLNTLWQAVLRYEAGHKIRFGAVVLHDAEDVVHPRELTVFDHLIPRKALVQLPVAPLPDLTSRWVSGTYQDEFAEAHLKDLVVRESIGAAVPSAGVACAIERGMLERVAAEAGGAPFDARCVTEDYEIGLRVHALGGRGCLVRIRSGDSDPTIVATREHFPATFSDAVRQKSRWLLGIALQGWDRLGWEGNLANRLMLLRDRKSIVAALLTLLAYLSFVLVLAMSALRLAYPPARAFPPLAPHGAILRPLLAFNLVTLSWRLAMRAACTWRAYGWREAVRSVPRALVGNVINIVAAGRALKIYVRLSLQRRDAVWERTPHRYPPSAMPAE